MRQFIWDQSTNDKRRLKIDASTRARGNKVITKSKRRQKNRRLSLTTDQCASAQEIREYLQDKTIVVYATQSFVRESTDSDKGNEIVNYLEPLVEKRLDFKYHKSVEAVF